MEPWIIIIFGGPRSRHFRFRVIPQFHTVQMLAFQRFFGVTISREMEAQPPRAENQHFFFWEEYAWEWMRSHRVNEFKVRVLSRVQTNPHTMEWFPFKNLELRTSLATSHETRLKKVTKWRRKPGANQCSFRSHCVAKKIFFREWEIVCLFWQS